MKEEEIIKPKSDLKSIKGIKNTLKDLKHETEMKDVFIIEKPSDEIEEREGL